MTEEVISPILIVTTTTDSLQTAVSSAAKLKSIVVGPSVASDPIIPVVPSLIKQLSNVISSIPSPVSLRHLSLLDINHDTPVPPYFFDNRILVHLAFILTPQLGEHALEKIALDYLDEEDEDLEMVIEEEEDPDKTVEVDDEPNPVLQEKDDSDLEMLDEAPLVFMAPGKKRTLKVKEKLDDSFLRRSKRVSQKMEGFKDEESAKKYKEEKTTKKPKDLKTAKKANKPKEAAPSAEEPIPLAMIPPAGMEVAPHLNKDILHGIRHGFLQIQSETAAAALLDKDDINE